MVEKSLFTLRRRRKAFLWRKILSEETILSAIHTQTDTYAHESITHFAQLFTTNFKKYKKDPNKQTINKGFTAEENSSPKRKTRQVCCLGKGNVLRLVFKKSTEGFFGRERKHRSRVGDVTGTSFCAGRGHEKHAWTSLFGVQSN